MPGFGTPLSHASISQCMGKNSSRYSCKNLRTRKNSNTENVRSQQNLTFIFHLERWSSSLHSPLGQPAPSQISSVSGNDPMAKRTSSACFSRKTTSGRRHSGAKYVRVQTHVLQSIVYQPERVIKSFRFTRKLSTQYKTAKLTRCLTQL